MGATISVKRKVPTPVASGEGTFRAGISNGNHRFIRKLEAYSMMSSLKGDQGETGAPQSCLSTEKWPFSRAGMERPMSSGGTEQTPWTAQSGSNRDFY